MEQSVCSKRGGRITHGMRGLKSVEASKYMVPLQSHPAWDAWIEIKDADSTVTKDGTSHPAWDAWIEILKL